ncbi:MAG: Sensory transduction histidine kinase [Cyanobacteria bacterium RYN_339]|nr:Sensory transduction histidine kinase [Cyanobacteria bacterium RYN_339]
MSYPTSMQGETEQLRGEVERLKGELRRARRELRRGNENGRRSLPERILAEVPVGMGYLDADLVFRWVNPACRALFERRPEAVLDRPLAEALPQLAGLLTPVLQQVLSTGRPVIGQELPLCRSHNGRDTMSYWDVSAVPLHGPDGEVDGVLLVDVDVSAIVASERAQRREVENLRTVDRYKDEFLSVISHELRTPLNLVVGFASLLDDEAAGALNERQHEFVGKILNGADRMLILVNDLLDFAKIKAGRLDLAPVPTPYGELLQEVIDTMRPLADDKGQTLELTTELPKLVDLDGPRIMQVVTNLVSNAIKFTGPGGLIKINAYLAGDDVVTQVSDTGMGIATEELPKLFQRFQQLDMSATRRAGGTGLGLAISKALVEAHGGHINVVSEPEAGSTFYFTLPLQ